MTHRAVICGLLALVPLIAGCGLFSDGQGLSSTPGTAPTEPMTVVPTNEPELTEQSAVLSVQESTPISAPPAAKEVPHEAPQPVAARIPLKVIAESAGEPSPPLTAKERILRSDTIVRARFSAIAATTRGYYNSAFLTNEHIPFVEFTFEVLETLKGNASGSIVVEMQVKPSSLRHGRSYADTAAKAVEYSRDWIANDFDSQWNDRQAILFLTSVANVRTDVTGRPSSVGYVFTSTVSI